MTVRVSMKQALWASLAVVLLPVAGAAQTDRVQIYTYDARGQMMSGTTVNPGGGDLVTQFDYDDAGNLIEVTDPAGRQVRAAYDDARRMISTTGAPGTGAQTHSRFRYDELGRLTHLDASPDGSSAPASWVTTQASYTPFGATASVIDPAGDTSQFSYYRNGWLNVSTDPEGRQARNWYYDDGMPREMAEAYGSAEEVRAVRFYFNAIGNQTGHRPAKGLSANPGVSVNTDDFDAQYSFDAYNRRSQWRLPERDDGSRLRERYQYDAAGNMTQRTTRAGEIITTEYDASSRPWRVTTPDGVTTTTYNLAGETTRMVGPDQHSTGQWQLDYAYDFAGRMTSEAILNPQGVSRTVSYEYDAAGNRTRITWPDGFSARYVYNAANQLTEVWMESAGGTSLRIAIYSYDGQGRLERYRLTGVNNALVGDIDFTYEIDGDLAQMDYSFGSGTDFTLDYSYDRSGWLTGRTVDNPAWDWSPSTSQVALSSDTYAANRMDQYTAVSSQAMSYDLNGNLTSDGTRSFVFSSQNQLLSATTSSGTSTYSYGPANRRVRKATAGGAVTDFLMAGEMVIAEYDGTGQLLRRYIPGAGVDQRVMMIQCNGSATCEPPEYTTARYQYYLPDRQGNVLATIYQGGNVEQQFHYTPFGVEMVGDPTGNPFRYTGRYYDAETDLYYYRARYYDADLGRFLSVDPIGYADQWNLYAYVGNSPLNANDPSGMVICPQCIAGAIGAGVGAVTGVASDVGGKLITGRANEITVSSVTSSAVGGAVTGGVIGATGNVALGTTLGAAAESVTRQAIETGSVDLTQTAADTAVGLATSAVPGVRVPGVTSGRNSMLARHRSQMTGLRNGTRGVTENTARIARDGAIASSVAASGDAIVGEVLEGAGVNEFVGEALEEVPESALEYLMHATPTESSCDTLVCI